MYKLIKFRVGEPWRWPRVWSLPILELIRETPSALYPDASKRVEVKWVEARGPIYPYFVEFFVLFISCLPSCLVLTSTTWKTSCCSSTTTSPRFFPIPKHTPDARFTCELLNGKNFAAWSRSVRLFLGGKGKSGWLLSTITKPNATYPKFVQWEIDNCTILGWLFNSMEPRIYHVFMYHDMVPLLWSSLTKMYAYARNEAHIFELYREIHQASHASLSLSLAVLTVQRTYQFLMGLKPEFEALRTQIVNTTPMSSIFEVFAILDGDERRHRLLQLPPPSVTESTIPDQMALCCFWCFKLHPELRETFKRNKEKSKLQTQFQNQMEQLQLQFQTQLGSLMQQSPRPNPNPSTATLASGADDHMTGELSLFTSHLSSIDQFVRIADGTKNSKKIFGGGYEWNGLYYFGDPSDSLPSMSLQASHVNMVFQQQFSCPYTPEQNGVAERKNCSIMTVVRCLLCGMHVPKHFWDMAVLTATYLLNRTPSRILLGYSFMSKGYRCYDPLTSHMHNSFDVTFLEDVPFFAGTPHSLNPRQGEAPKDPSIFSRHVPLFESPQVASPTLPPVLTSNPRHMYSRRPPASDPLPQSSPESGNISPISSPVLRRYPTRDRRPPDKLGFSTPMLLNILLLKYVSYQGLSNSYRTFIGHVSSTPIPRSVSETLRDPPIGLLLCKLKWLFFSKIIHGILSLFLGVSKYQADGIIKRYKARLVAKGFTQFMHTPRSSDLDAVHHILRYLKTCPGLGLFYTSGEQCGLSCFTDADYAGSKTDRRSTSGLCTFRGTHLLSWKSKKQVVVSRSSAEAEYRAMAQEERVYLDVCSVWRKR
ncbi:hypothetical protein Acr_11g0011830 [Actinidia rufa]|uniref:Integrase catalytic domain-containing protein n=1 Tax=Actinidia rufa TaxID=165716 RepID=A0A7J0FG48_9ERIC|nr:hypothetical protein Acr_11g0011830 [Actinidia rufa]